MPGTSRPRCQEVLTPVTPWRSHVCNARLAKHPNVSNRLRGAHSQMEEHRYGVTVMGGHVATLCSVKWRTKTHTVMFPCNFF
jgi:hypothetical protein